MTKIAPGIAGTPSVAAPTHHPRRGKLARSSIRWPGVAQTQATEVRWFVRGGGPLLDGAVRVCTDSYRTDMLADGVSVKSRSGDGSGVFAKIRIAVLAPVEIGNRLGTPEAWLRWELDALPPGADEMQVHKVIARRKGVEVVHLAVGGDVWWSVAVRVKGLELPRLPTDIELHLKHNEDDAHCCSYPAWLRLLSNAGIHSAPVGGPRPSTSTRAVSG